MKNYSNCGSEITNEVVNNGCCSYGTVQNSYNQAIKVFLVLACVSAVFGISFPPVPLLPMLWCIPMTISLWKKMDNEEYIGIGFKICTLLFLSLIGGILLLCADHNR